jgi:hypothetical protein
MNQKSPARPPRPRRRRSWRLMIVPPLQLLAACSSSGGTSTQPASGYVITDNVKAPGPHLYIPTGRYVALGVRSFFYERSSAMLPLAVAGGAGWRVPGDPVRRPERHDAQRKDEETSRAAAPSQQTLPSDLPSALPSGVP